MFNVLNKGSQWALYFVNQISLRALFCSLLRLSLFNPHNNVQ